MTFEINVRNENGYLVDEAQLCKAARIVLTALKHPDDLSEGAMTIVITTDEEVTSLNRQYREIDAPTDVLSFPADVPQFAGEAAYYGDLVIAYSYAAAQAERETHDLNDSLLLLVVHGTLHLLGYDHDTSERRAQMWGLQEDALSGLGISPAIVPSLER